MREVTDASFSREVLAAEGPVLVDFWAPWCGPCKAVDKLLADLEAGNRGRVSFVKMNIDEQPDRAAEHGVLSIPTVILFEGGAPRATVVGARSRSHFEQVFGDWL